MSRRRKRIRFTNIVWAFYSLEDKKIADCLKNINKTDRDENTALHHAVSYGSKQDLIQRTYFKCHLPSCRPKEQGPLGELNGQRHIEVVKKLVDNGADVNAINKNGETPLSLAVLNGYFDIAKYLIGVKAVDVNKDNGAALSHCVFHHHDSDGERWLDIVKEMVGRGADVNAPINGFRTILLSATLCKNYDMVSFLIEAEGIKLNEYGERGSTALHHVVSFDDKGIHILRPDEYYHVKIVVALIRRGANLNVINDEFETPLNIATSLDYINIAKILILGGAIVTNSDIVSLSNGKHGNVVNDKLREEIWQTNTEQRRFAETDLHIAASLGFENKVRALLEKGADLNVADDLKYRPLHLAVENQHWTVVKLLLQYDRNGNKCDVNVKNANGNTPLHLLMRGECNETSIELLNLLITNGAKIDERSHSGRTALHVAAMCGSVEWLKLLINNHKANVQALDNFGNTVLHLAFFTCINVCVNLSKDRLPMRNKRADFIERCGYLMPPMTCVANILWFQKSCEKSDECQASTDYVNETERYHCGVLLHNVIETLLALNADVNTANVEGLLPIHLSAAISSISPETLELLLDKGVDCTISDPRGLTPLHYLFLFLISGHYHASDSSPEQSLKLVVHKLKQAGADVNAQTRSSRVTPLHWARKYLKFINTFPARLIAEELVNCSESSMYIRDSMGNTAYHYFTKLSDDKQCNNNSHHHIKNYSGLSACLLNYKHMTSLPPCLSDDKDRLGRTVLHIHCATDVSRHSLDISLVLKQCKTLDILDTKDFMDRTALHYLCINSHFYRKSDLNTYSDKLKAFKRSLGKISHQVNSRDKFGRTPLFYATLYHDDIFIEWLLKTGADASICDEDGIYPEDIAKARHLRSVSRLRAANRQKHNDYNNGERSISQVKSLFCEQNLSKERLENAYSEYKTLASWCTNKDEEIHLKFLNDAVQTIVVNIMRKVEEIDETFASADILLSGSSYEKTRIEYLPEYDFLIPLTTFEQIVKAEISQDHPNYVTYKRVSNDVQFNSFFSNNGILQLQVIKDRLYALITQATSYFEIWRDSIFELQSFSIHYNASSPAITITLSPNRLLGGNRLIILHAQSLDDVSISVDLVPCLRTAEVLSYDSALLRYTIQYDTELKHSYTVFRKLKDFYGMKRTELCLPTFAILESEIIRKSPEAVRAAYMWLKIQKRVKECFHKPFLKNCLLHCILEGKFDGVDILTECSLKLCIGIITAKLLECIKQNSMVSVSHSALHLPIWKSSRYTDPFAQYSTGMLARLGIGYPAVEYDDTLLVHTSLKDFVSNYKMFVDWFSHLTLNNKCTPVQDVDLSVEGSLEERVTMYNDYQFEQDFYQVVSNRLIYFN